MTAEEWRPVAGYADYQISSLGRVLSRAPRKGNQSPRLLRPGLTTAGYPTVVLCRPGQKRTHYIHHLVAEAFIGPRPKDMDIRHLDGNPANCEPSNLAYGTVSDNAYDRVRHGTHVQSRKTRCPQNHPYDETNTYIQPSTGGRVCRTCRIAHRRAYRERQMFLAANVQMAA